jgi:hypothetical protein
MPLPDVVDYDTLLFAPALATRGRAVRPVVAELLAAANNPDRLQGIDPTLTRVRAADLLCLEHDPALLDDAVAILREAIALALPGELTVAQDALVKTLAEQGNIAELEDFMQALLRQPPSVSWALTLDNGSTMSAVYGYGQNAARWLDAAFAATDGVGRSGRSTRNQAASAARSRASIRDVLQDGKKRLARLRAVMTADGYDPDDPVAAHARMWTRPTAAATVDSYPPWPAGFQGRLVWWPEPEYDRLTRQLAEMATVLGDPWRGHTARVEGVMSGRAGPAGGADATAGAGQAADRAVRPKSLVAADFGQFAQFLEWSRADPVDPATMTAFGALASKLPGPVRWPPRDRAPCWCGSGLRYRDCCARPR